MRYLLALMLCLIAGVASAERIIDLPRDQDQWYVSVVGNASDVTYQQILSWFDSDPDLKAVKSHVHFCPVTTDDPMYARYAPNTKTLPMVRVQDAEGYVLAEVAGNIPSTPERLYNAIGVQVELKWL